MSHLEIITAARCVLVERSYGATPEELAALALSLVEKIVADDTAEREVGYHQQGSGA